MFVSEIKTNMFTIPNLITLLNLFFGCLAAISILNGAYHLGIIFSLAGGLADFLDGLVARALNVQSAIGKELDSLADMVSFGFVPGLIFYKILLMVIPWSTVSIINWYAAPAFLITLFSALRLAKFNLDNRQTYSFIGMPTPAATVWALGWLWLVAEGLDDSLPWLFSPAVLYILIVFISFLLVAEIPMFSLKFQNFKWKDNAVRYLFMASLLAVFISIPHFGPFLVIPLYVLFSILGNIKTNEKPDEPDNGILP